MVQLSSLTEINNWIVVTSKYSKKPFDSLEFQVKRSIN
jgi:hypothetical protein